MKHEASIRRAIHQYLARCTRGDTTRTTMKGKKKTHEPHKQQVDTSRKVTQVRERDLPVAEVEKFREVGNEESEEKNQKWF
jgi:hypothetical protein